MKNSLVGLLIITGTISSCSSLMHTQDNGVQSPPHNIKQVESSTAIVPQFNKNTPHSLAKFESQTPYTPFNRIEETRSYGGSVSAIKVNNRGKIPDYYLLPNQQPDPSVNNRQLNITTPTWQLNW